jgi:hypothetical protein
MSAEQARERIGAALDAIDAAHDVLRATSSDVVGNDFRVEVAERLETQERTNRGLVYRFFAEIADPTDGGGFVPGVRATSCGRGCASRPTRSPAASGWRPGSGRGGR